MSDKVGKESQYMISHPELCLDPSIGSDRESGRDRHCNHACIFDIISYFDHGYKCLSYILLYV